MSVFEIEFLSTTKKKIEELSMSYTINIVGEDKESKYQSLMPQLSGLISDQDPLVSNLANVCAALKEGFGFFWVGFYLEEAGHLVLGPFQGSVACTRIQSGKGVCGASFQEKKTIVVKDVDEFPGHIACSSLSKSEIVVPIIKNGDVKMVLDIDSDQLNDFDAIDQKYLEKLAELITEIC